MVHNKQTANRLLRGTMLGHADRPNWLAEKVIYDLERDRVQEGDRFGFGLDNKILLLYHCYPFDKFLVNGKAWVERETGKNGKMQKRDRSLRKFQAYLGMSYGYRQSGDKNSRRFHGSSLVRAHLYAWAVCMVAPSSSRIKTDIGINLSKRYHELRQKVKGKDALIRILFKATRMLFYELLNETISQIEVAQAYERTRPRYPAKILAHLQEIAQLQPPKAMLEIGTGSGIASVEFAKMGVEMICLEPSLPAYRLAQQKCAAYSNVQFINTTFEEWELTNQKFDVVVATTSFHWLTPEIRTQKTAAALKEDGLLILLWNTPPQPSYKVHQALTDIYQNHAPELDKYETLANYQENLGKMGQEVIDSGYFKDLTEEHLISKVNYTINDYLTLLSTLSPYIRLQREQRNRLFAELRQILQLNFDNQLQLIYLSMMQIAHKS